MYSIIWTIKAEVDFKQIKIWYENRKPNLGVEFGKEVTTAIEKYITIFPKLARIISPSKRQYFLKRFPYSLIYLVDEDKKRIQILAVLHHKQMLKV